MMTGSCSNNRLILSAWSCRPTLVVSWSGVPDSSSLHAEVASYELEVSDQTEASFSSSQRHTCSGKVQSFTVNNMQPGSRYQVMLNSRGCAHKRA